MSPPARRRTSYYSAAGQVLEESVGGRVYSALCLESRLRQCLILRDTDTSGTGLVATGGSYTRVWMHPGCELQCRGAAEFERKHHRALRLYAIWSSHDHGLGAGTVLSGSAFGMVYLWQGMRFDAISGSFSSQSRLYNVALQRWDSLDPDGLGAGDSEYVPSGGETGSRSIGSTGLSVDPATATGPRLLLERRWWRTLGGRRSCSSRSRCGCCRIGIGMGLAEHWFRSMGWHWHASRYTAMSWRKRLSHCYDGLPSLRRSTRVDEDVDCDRQKNRPVFRLYTDRTPTGKVN